MGERYFFPGGNTPKGFVGRFEDIIPFARARRIYFIKGGSGVGKSTFMRRIGQKYAEQGYDVEYFNCSSDPGSLDGVAIPQLGVALMDGTAPHVMDPKIPGARDFTLNLGAFLDEEKFRGELAELDTAMARRLSCFVRAYSYLSAAAELYRDAARANNERIKSNDWILGEIKRVLDDKLKNCEQEDKPAQKYWIEDQHGVKEANPDEITADAHKKPDAHPIIRRLFAEAVTPDGLYSVLDTLSPAFAINVELPWGCTAAGALETLAADMAHDGYDAILLMNPLAPDDALHLFAPEIGLLVSADGGLVERKVMFDVNIVAADDGNGFGEGEEGAAIRADAGFDQRECTRLIEAAVARLNRARIMHAQVETVYSSAMDFDGVQKLREKTINEIDALMT